MGLYEQVDYDFSGPLQLQDLFGREYVTMGGVIDHHLTTTVQSHIKMPKKPVVITDNRLFLVLAANVQSQQNSRSYVRLCRPVVILRRQVPGVRIPSGAPKACDKKDVASFFFTVSSKIGSFTTQFWDAVLQCCPTIFRAVSPT